MKGEDFIKFYKKWIEPFFAMAVLVMVCILVARLTTYNHLQKEIAENCGWEDEDTRCYCEKGEVIAWENEIKDKIGDINFTLEDDTNG
jgi:hypothetical protein